MKLTPEQHWQVIIRDNKTNWRFLDNLSSFLCLLSSSGAHLLNCVEAKEKYNSIYEVEGFEDFRET